ncbi:MAG TPA: V-type ATP synthase subunit E [Candidatus Limivivens merdigallinarum]|mgnify:CR=1 FL=1|uniref:V-type ATP synthase subunit E n=1 Tax=Candidatus Limivivens merdigallinarum TaxID=2840859 RepID=A0A9D1CZD6_9FIRM|nr:V-type ATP synthase subunit E [Candidatus Limivivens merdigallinarum]
MTTEEKLKHFEEAALEEARQKSAKAVEEHRQVLEKLKQDHIDEKDRQAALQIKTETDKLKRANNMAVSKEEIEIKRQISRKHDELKEKLFVEVRQKLDDFMTTSAYQKLLIREIKEVLEVAGEDEVTIYIDPADESMLTSLHAATNTALTLSQYSFGGGIRAVLPSRHILIDNSFSTKLGEIKQDFRFDGGMSHE